MRKLLTLLGDLTFRRKNGRAQFKSGERVQILSYEKIKQTLDERNCCEGLVFMKSMAEFCGRDYEVLREVKWLYDERSMKMIRCKDVFVLKDLVCDGKGILDGKDCDRSCLYFWKNTWLERV